MTKMAWWRLDAAVCMAARARQGNSLTRGGQRRGGRINWKRAYRAPGVGTRRPAAWTIIMPSRRAGGEGIGRLAVASREVALVRTAATGRPLAPPEAGGTLRGWTRVSGWGWAGRFAGGGGVERTTGAAPTEALAQANRTHNATAFHRVPPCRQQGVAINCGSSRHDPIPRTLSRDRLPYRPRRRSGGRTAHRSVSTGADLRPTTLSHNLWPHPRQHTIGTCRCSPIQSEYINNHSQVCRCSSGLSGRGRFPPTIAV